MVLVPGVLSRRKGLVCASLLSLGVAAAYGAGSALARVGSHTWPRQIRTGCVGAAVTECTIVSGANSCGGLLLPTRAQEAMSCGCKPIARATPRESRWR